MIDQKQIHKANQLLDLHHGEDILLLLNTWDAGSSKIVENLGYKAIGTTSMGIAASLGYADSETIPFIEMVEAVKRITDKVNIPVSADIEAGYGSNIQTIVNNTRDMIYAGVVGINIEDSIRMSPDLVDAKSFAERITAIREMAKQEGIHLVINARTDVYITQSGDPQTRLQRSIERGNMYREAGADCIFVPNVMEKKDIISLVNEIDAPLNVLSNPTVGTGYPPTINELKDMGVARVSVGSSVMKSTLLNVKNIAEEILQKGEYKQLASYLSPIEQTAMAYKMAIK